MPDMTTLGARFLLTSGHLVATCMASTTPTSAAGLQPAGVVALLAFIVAFAGLFAGLDVFSPTKNTIHVLSHFLGGVMVCRMILQGLQPASYLWYVVLFTHLPTSMCTLDAILQLFILKTVRQPFH